MTHVDAIRAPLFIQHGANDPRVPLSESEHIHAVLTEKGIRCELVVYADEGHIDREAPEPDRRVHARRRLPRRGPGLARPRVRWAPLGALAEWLGTGLQNLVHRFDSGRRL